MKQIQNVGAKIDFEDFPNYDVIFWLWSRHATKEDGFDGVSYGERQESKLACDCTSNVFPFLFHMPYTN